MNEIKTNQTPAFRGFIYKKAGFDENSVSEYIAKYLNPSKSFNFGWGSLNHTLIKNSVPVPHYDNKVISVYQDPKGQLRLIDQVIDFIKKKSGKTILRDQIMLTNGATNGIFLLTHYLAHVKGRNSVVLQNPVYDTALNIFRSQDVKIITVGPYCTKLPNVNNAFAYLIFKFQNPTGISINYKKKEKIIAKMLATGNYVIEDDAYGLLEPNGVIDIFDDPSYIYVSSFSKYIFPGLRLGYIIANPEIIYELQIIQKYYNSHPNILSQYLLGEYLKNNLIEDEIKHKAILVQERRKEFEKNISKKIKSHCSKSEGGFYYWLNLASRYSSVEVFKELLIHGVIVIPGDIYFFSGLYPALRLNISLIDKDKIAEGCQIINQVAEKYV